MAKHTIQIEVIHDIMCPWCFIGKRRLQKAMDRVKSTHPDTVFGLQYMPYQLDASLSKTAIPLTQYLYDKFGEEHMTKLIPLMKDIGKEEGIRFTYNGVVSNTLDAHRLVLWSEGFDRQSDMLEELFKLHFELDKCLCDYEELASAAGRIGLSKSEALVYLQSNEGEDTVRTMLQKNAKVSGVPTVTFSEKYMLAGAQEVDTLVETLEMIIGTNS